jgi:hypothetical protein
MFFFASWMILKYFFNLGSSKPGSRYGSGSQKPGSGFGVNGPETLGPLVVRIYPFNYSEQSDVKLS